MKGKEESKGNFMDLIVEASRQSKLRTEFIDIVYKKDITADKLLVFFHKAGYEGVSLEDCNKLLIIAGHGSLPCDFTGVQKY